MPSGMCNTLLTTCMSLLQRTVLLLLHAGSSRSAGTAARDARHFAHGRLPYQ